MRSLAAFLLAGALLLPLSACRAPERADRVAAVREKYADAAYSAAAEVEVYGGEERTTYTLRFDADAEETRVTVLAPDLLAGVTARLAADTLALEYDGLVLDAGGAVDGVSAVNCVPLVLRALAEGSLTEESEEEIDRDGERVHALRLGFESEHDGETLRCTVWLDSADALLRAEIAENEKITAFMEFTSFSFYAIIAPSEGS